jgi:ribonuclease D
MIKYAANDVIFLPKIYNMMLKMIKTIKSLTITDVLNSCEAYLKYPDLNIDISIKMRELLESNTQIQGLIK